MSLPRALFVATTLLASRALTATIDEFLPWVAPSPSAFGTPFSEFLKAHPSAQDISSSERPAGQPFQGGLMEQLKDGSVFLYGFLDDKLASIHWSSGRGVDIPNTLLMVRSKLIASHGAPTAIESAARIDTDGLVARILREVYRPALDKDAVICLIATSEGVEVALTNEAIERKHGIKTSRETYEEAERDLTSVVPSINKPSAIIDYLAAERAKIETPQPDAKPPVRQAPTASSPVPTPKALPSTSVEQVSQGPAPVVVHKPSILPWIIGIVAVSVIASLLWKRHT